MRKQRIVLAIFSLFAASISIAHAQYQWFGPPGAGPYFRAGVGPTIFEDSMLKGYTYPGFTGPSGKVDYDVGVSGAVGFGWAFDKFVSAGLETGYTWGRINSVQNYFASGSTMGNVPFMANVTLSMPIPHTNIIPYIGGSAGGADSIFDAHNMAPIAADIPANTIDGSRDDIVFAYQAIAGIRFKLNPNLAVGVGYDFLGTSNPTFGYPPHPKLNATFEGIRSHSILLTFQANF